MISGLVSIKHGFMGPNTSVVTACSTGNHLYRNRLLDLYRVVKQTVMIAGGAEMASTPLSIAGFISARGSFYESRPYKQASRPWDRDRDGFVLSDGAGSLVLEGV
jgi:3-oxoacyl-[acyl-carrier-protein] synthase II